MSKLSYYPDMPYEVLEAVHLMYEDYPEVEVDCLLFISKLSENFSEVTRFSNLAKQKLTDMERCYNCGEILQYYHYKEPHPELEGCPMEDMCVLICPTCDLKGGKLVD